jgi:hypothetical protein
MSNDNPNIVHGSEMQSVLYYKFVFQKQYSKDELAIFLNKAPDTVYRYCSGHLPIPADAARDIIRFVAEKNPKDTELLDFFCRPAGFIAVPVAQGKLFTRKDRRDHELQISVLNGETIKQIEAAYKDGKLSRAEFQAVSRTLSRLIQEAKELEQHLKDEVR